MSISFYMRYAAVLSIVRNGFLPDADYFHRMTQREIGRMPVLQPQNYIIPVTTAICKNNRKVTTIVF